MQLTNTNLAASRPRGLSSSKRQVFSGPLFHLMDQKQGIRSTFKSFSCDTEFPNLLSFFKQKTMVCYFPSGRKVARWT